MKKEKKKKRGGKTPSSPLRFLKVLKFCSVDVFHFTFLSSSYVVNNSCYIFHTYIGSEKIAERRKGGDKKGSRKEGEQREGGGGKGREKIRIETDWIMLSKHFA